MKMNEELGALLSSITQNEIKDFLFVLHGTFSAEIVTNSIGMIEKNVSLAGYSKQIITKVKMIGIEILQNIQKHQSQLDQHHPYFVITSSLNSLQIYAGNVVSNDVKTIVGERLSAYKSIDPTVIKDFYIESLRNTQINSKSNASLGLLDIVYRSNQNIKYAFKQLNESHSFFGLEVCLETNVN